MTVTKEQKSHAFYGIIGAATSGIAISIIVWVFGFGQAFSQVKNNSVRLDQIEEDIRSLPVIRQQLKEMQLMDQRMYDVMIKFLSSQLEENKNALQRQSEK